MTKDEQIAFLMARLQKAEDALDRIREANRTRQSRRRSRDSNCDSNVTVTSGGDYRGGNVLSLEGDTENGTKNQEKVRETHTNGRVVGKPKRDCHVTPDADFDRFKEAYPRLTNRTHWGETRKRWDGLSKADRAAALVAVANYAVCRDVLRGAEAGAQVFVSKRMWEQHQHPEPPLPSGNGHAEPAGFAALREYNRRREAAEVLEGELV